MKMERLTTGIFPRALTLACTWKGIRQHCPKEELPSAVLADEAALILVARQELGGPRGGHSAEG